MKRKLILALALVAPLLAAGQTTTGVATVPDVDVQVTPERDTVHLKETVPVVVIVTNRSKFPLTHVKLTILPATGQFNDLPSIPETIPAFSLANGSIVLTANDILNNPGSSPARALSATSPPPNYPDQFGKHKVTVLCTYTWIDGGKELSSGKSVAVDLQLSRQFEEEAKALPGGSAAILYMILPVITAFIGYGLLESLRLGNGFQIPEFKASYVAVAFLLSIAVNFIMRAIIHFDQSFIYAEPKTFLLTLLISALLGALIPGSRWLIRGLQWYWYGFPENPSDLEYVRKVLRSKPNGEIDWVELESYGEKWEGLYLTQPDDTIVLGQRLQISPKDQKDAEALTAALQLDPKQKKLKNKRALFTLIETGKVNLVAQAFIKRAGASLSQEKKVALLGVRGLVPSTRTTSAFLTKVE